MKTDKHAAGADEREGAAGVYTRELVIPSMAELDVVDVTAEVAAAVRDSGLSDGAVTVFVPGATGAVTCLEFEPGVLEDFRAAIGRMAPRDIHYQHNVYQADGNGRSHVRAGLLGPSMSVPFIAGSLTLGTWQQIVLVNCDNRTRDRRLVVQVTGA